MAVSHKGPFSTVFTMLRHLKMLGYDARFQKSDGTIVNKLEQLIGKVQCSCNVPF